MKKITVKILILFTLLLGTNADLLAQTRIRFARGRTSASISSQIGAQIDRSFVLGARYGQYLSANVSSRNGCVKFTNRSTEISYVTQAGDNYLYIINTCRNVTSFTITVSINYGSD